MTSRTVNMSVVTRTTRVLFMLIPREFQHDPHRRYAVLSHKAIKSYKNENEYQKSLLTIKEHKRLKKETKSKKCDVLIANEDDDEKISSVNLPKELLTLKYKKPNPSDMGQFSKLMLNLKSRAFRERNFSCLLEGKFLISEAIKSGSFIRTIYFTRLSNLVDFPLDILKKTNLVKVRLSEIKIASEVKHQATGLIAIASKPQENAQKRFKLLRSLQNKNVLPLTLICDQVKDPGNLGTLIRSAASAGCHQVLLTVGCCDFWDPKVVRAASGAHFKMPITNNLEWEEIEEILKKLSTKRIFLSHHSKDPVDLDKLKEDSLKSMFEEKKAEIEQSNFEEVTSPENLIHSKFHHEIKYFEKGHTALVVGSEVGGISDEGFLSAAKFREGKNSELLLATIPMFDGTDCLNASVAGSILLFEAKRQYIMQK